MRAYMSLFAAIALWLPLSAMAAGTYTVSAVLKDGDATFGTPSLQVAAGVPARMEITGTDGYRLQVTVSEHAPGALAVSADLASARGAMPPTLVVRPGEPASVSVGALAMTLTVEPVDG